MGDPVGPSSRHRGPPSSLPFLSTAARHRSSPMGSVASGGELDPIPVGQAVRVRRRGAVRPLIERSAFARFRFPPEVITVAVRWYLRYRLSYRDVEELLAERGIEVDHMTVFRWVQRFTPLFRTGERRRGIRPACSGEA